MNVGIRYGQAGRHRVAVSDWIGVLDDHRADLVCHRVAVVQVGDSDDHADVGPRTVAIWPLHTPPVVESNTRRSVLKYGV